MEEKIKCFIECLIPITSCNIKCHYCYVIQRDRRNMQMANMKYSPEIIAKALNKKRLGGVAYISICGAGETMMQKELPEIVLNLLSEGHYINITTNGTITPAFKKIIQLIPIDLLKRINFSFSFHYIELKKKNLLNIFFNNIKLVKDNGCSFIVQLNWCDEYEKCIDEIKQICIENVGAYPQLAATRDEKNSKLYTNKPINQYIESGATFKSPLFDFTLKNYMKKRTEFCYAGKWSYVLNLATGIIKPCYASNIRKNIFQNINEPINFAPIGRYCSSPFCMNSSHFISLGVIPSIECPTYEALRNRKCKDGTMWYNETMESVLSHKLSEVNNLQYNKLHYLIQNNADKIINYFLNNVSSKTYNKIRSLVNKLNV